MDLTLLQWLELLAVALAVLYLLLAIRQNIWCWLCAGLSTAIYVYLFYGAKLYMESALNLFYFGMAIYGWAVWYLGRSGDAELPVSVWKRHVHALAVAAISTIVSGAVIGLADTAPACASTDELSKASIARLPSAVKLERSM